MKLTASDCLGESNTEIRVTGILCTEFRQCQLLRAIVSIMKIQPVFEEEILSPFNESFPDGRKVFDRLLNEEV